MSMAKQRIALLVLALACMPQRALSQEIACIQPKRTGVEGVCELRLAHNPAREVLAVRVSHEAVIQKGRQVVFYELGGTWRDTAPTGENGEAQVIWARESIRDTVVIGVRVAGDSQPLATRIRIVPPPPAATLRRPDRDSLRWGYIERQLRQPVVVEVVGPRVESDCTALTVAFEPTDDGATTAKTTRADWDDAAKHCTARTYWRLGKTTGKQTLTARIAGSPDAPVAMMAGARSTPTFVVGLSFTSTGRYTTLASTSSKLHVTRELPDGRGTYEFDSTTTTTAPKETGSTWRLVPVVGVDWPLFVSVRQLRVSVTASTNPREDWFVGASLLHLVPSKLGGIGFIQEGFGLNLHAVLHFGERTLVTNALECNTGAVKCETSSPHRLLGAGLALTFSGHTLLDVLAKAIPVR